LWFRLEVHKTSPASASYRVIRGNNSERPGFYFPLLFFPSFLAQTRYHVPSYKGPIRRFSLSEKTVERENPPFFFPLLFPVAFFLSVSFLFFGLILFLPRPGLSYVYPAWSVPFEVVPTKVRLPFSPPPFFWVFWRSFVKNAYILARQHLYDPDCTPVDPSEFPFPPLLPFAKFSPGPLLSTRTCVSPAPSFPPIKWREFCLSYALALNFFLMPVPSWCNNFLYPPPSPDMDPSSDQPTFSLSEKRHTSRVPSGLLNEMSFVPFPQSILPISAVLPSCLKPSKEKLVKSFPFFIVPYSSV